ncbi:ParA family protein [Streptosporangium canum]|uniref:ParA family protein n=1 Tax=Streptosporangium canum TaxID=324952 RepID=UPI0036CF8AB0
MARVLGFANQSGGSVKTTSVGGIAYTVATHLKRPARVIDADDQRDISRIFGYDDPDADENLATFADVLAGDATIAQATVPARRFIDGAWEPIPNLFLVPGSKELASAESFLTDPNDRNYVLQDALASDDTEAITLMDFPGSLNIVTINGLYAADGIIACVKPGLKEIRALTELESTMEKVNRRRPKNHQIQLDGVIIGDMFAKSQGHAYSDAAELASEMYGELLLPSVVHSVKVVEAFAAQRSVVDYAPGEKVSEDYIAITEEMDKRGLFG